MIPRKPAIKRTIPFYPQEKPYTCGPATIRMALAALGRRVTEKYLVKMTGTTAKHGTTSAQMIKCLRKLKVAHMTGYNLRYHDLMYYANQGIAIIDWAPQVLFPYHPEFVHTEHFNPTEESHCAIVLSVSPKFIVIRDPVLGKKIKLSRTNFLKAWNSPEEDRWMLVVMPRELQ
ncbi:C39 family peptidase [Candidatus Woesearchaeota archaeon]|nr:C39 family peptidase [Candidatus Woesearchaeota archaeon]